MTTIIVPPPTIEYMISHIIEWIAKHMRAKVTITVVNDNVDFTEEYDGRI